LPETVQNAITSKIQTVELNNGDIITAKKKDSKETYDIEILDYDPETKEYSIKYTIDGITYPA
jgi:argininosuccinate synthase